MEAERDKAVSLVECFYWVLTTMSTLGYGDITFKGDAGRLFSMMVMFTGVFYLFIVLPLFSWSSSTSLSWNTRLEQECLGNSSIRKGIRYFDSL